MRQRANEVARRILKEHYPKPLDETQARELERLAWEMAKEGNSWRIYQPQPGWTSTTNSVSKL